MKNDQYGRATMEWSKYGNERRITYHRCIDKELSNAVFHFHVGYMCKKKVKRIGTSLVEGAVNDFSF